MGLRGFWLNNKWLSHDKSVQIFSNGAWKYKKSEISGASVDPNDKSIEIYLRLKDINSPAQFRISFYSDNVVSLKGDKLRVSDLTDWIVIPPYNIDLVSDTNHVELSAGESKVLRWVLNSTSDLQGYYRLVLNNERFYEEELVTNSSGLSNCIFNSSDNTENQERFEQALNALDSNTNNSTKKSLFPQGVHLIGNFPSKSINGFQVDNPIGLVNFQAFSQYIILMNLKSESNARQGINYLTVNANPADLSEVDPLKQNASSSVFGNETFYSCVPGYSFKSSNSTDLNITVFTLPPKTIIDRISEWFQTKPGLAQFVTAVTVGVLSSFLTLVVDRRRNRPRK